MATPSIPNTTTPPGIPAGAFYTLCCAVCWTDEREPNQYHKIAFL